MTSCYISPSTLCLRFVYPEIFPIAIKNILIQALYVGIPLIFRPFKQLYDAIPHGSGRRHTYPPFAFLFSCLVFFFEFLRFFLSAKKFISRGRDKCISPYWVIASFLGSLSLLSLS